MSVGLAFPTLEIGDRPDAIRTWAEQAEQAGADHVAVADHVLGVKPDAVEHGWDATWPYHGSRSPYTHEHPFHEAFVTMGFLAAVTRLELMTGVTVLPQRSTSLVAKQAAEVDLLTDGAFRLGVGVGWNAAEYRSMGADFASRGRRLEEQIDVLRQFWTQEAVDYQGEFHDIRGAGISPPPRQRPIPIWIGGATPSGGVKRVAPLLKRIGRLADGWCLGSGAQPGPDMREAIDVVRDAAASAGRDPVALGLDARVIAADLSDHDRAALVGEWSLLASRT